MIDIGLNNHQQVDDAAQTSAVSLAKGGYWDLDSVELKKELLVGELCRKLLRMYGNEYVAIYGVNAIKRREKLFMSEKKGAKVQRL